MNRVSRGTYPMRSYPTHPAGLPDKEDIDSLLKISGPFHLYSHYSYHRGIP
jgi:hypothetical protein